MKHWLLIVLCVPMLLLVGCQASVKAPRVSVAQVRLVEQTAEGARVEVTLAVSNPNTTSLPLRDAHFTLTVPGAGTYAFKDTTDRVLPASITPSGGSQVPLSNQTATVVLLPAAIATTTPLDGAAYRVTGSVSYQPDTFWRRMLDEMSVPLPTVGFEQSGRLP